MWHKPSVLVLAEDRTIREMLLCLLADLGMMVNSGEPPTAVLVGCRSRVAKNDLETARAISRKDRRIPFILLTSEGSESLAIEALRSGATNYLRLPISAAELARALDDSAPSSYPALAVDRLIGTSQAIRDVKAYLLRVAVCSSNVLITGETGTGKELAADLVHSYSSRKAKPLIAINCAAIPDSLMESELFGFERGAFTGAHVAQCGRLILADGGDVFLDEVGDLSPYSQAKLLRAIETGEIQRLGGRQSQRIDIRVIAATNRNLETDPNFRKDLYFRLNVARVHLPPLRERKEDILPLAELFRAEFDLKFACRTKGFTVAAQQRLLTYHWPGNVRELHNVIEAAFIELGPDSDVSVELPAQFRKALAGASVTEQERILLALSQTRWNKSRAAEALHWSRMTLYRKIKRHGIAIASHV